MFFVPSVFDLPQNSRPMLPSTTRNVVHMKVKMPRDIGNEGNGCDEAPLQ